MTTTIIMTKGLPGSGKSTWARETVAESEGKIARVNKDDLRAMLDGSAWSKEREKTIVGARDDIVRRVLRQGRSIIVDDTNFAPTHERALRAIAEQEGAQFRVADFTGVPLKTCIERDLKRPNSVGHRVINKMHLQYLAKQYEPPKHDPNLPDAIIVDIDGTLAHMDGRSPYDYSRVGEDKVDEVVKQLVCNAVMDLQHVLLVSGRKSECRSATKDWLSYHGIPYTSLWMREDGDNRDDSVVKGEIYEENILNRYNVMFVLDDRDRVVDMWRQRGLKVLQVEDGNF